MSGAIKMCGPPRRVYLLDSLELHSPKVQLISKQAFAGFEQDQPLPCRLRKHRGKGPGLKVTLPKETEPGCYHAQLVDGSQVEDVVIEVQPQPKLKFLPKILNFKGNKGAAIQTELALVNQGNVAIQIPDSAIGNLYHLQQIPEALTDLFRQEELSDVLPTDQLLRNLKKGYGGIMKWHIQADNTELAVNQKMIIGIKSRIPKTAQSGLRYAGMMHLDQFHLNYEVSVI